MQIAATHYFISNARNFIVADMNKPNILFIMSDQMRHDALACNGNAHIKTPGFDRMAARGVNFINSFTPNPICVPARASITTGMYSNKCTGQKDNDGIIKEGMPLMGEELRRAGYATYAMGKLHYEPYSPPGVPRVTHGIDNVELHESGRILGQFDPGHKLRGLEDYHDYLHEVGWGGYSRGNGMGNNDIYPAVSAIPAEHYSDAWVANRAIFHMDKHITENPDQPFFMWASFPKPHSAFDPPRPFDSMYDPRTLPPPTGTIEDIIERGHLDWYRQWWIRYWDLLSPECKQVIKAHYYGLVSFQDTCVEKMLDFLDAKAPNTIVVYTADHGEMLGDFGIYFKANMYNGSIRVPFMISFPGVIPAGVQSDALVGLQDILPTLMSLIGCLMETEVDGCDLTPVLTGRDTGRDIYVAQTGDSPKQEYMAVSREFKYIYGEMGGREELYDQANDIHELQDLSDNPQYAGVKAGLKNKLTDWLKVNDPGMINSTGYSQSPVEFSLEKPDRHNLYGRRHY